MPPGLGDAVKHMRSYLGARVGAAVLALAVATACSDADAGADMADEASDAPASTASADGAQEAPNTLTAAERDAGWRLLFDGETLEGWRGYDSPEVPAGWRVEDGTLHRFDGPGDIVTVDQFSSFELKVDWKVGPAGNSGIFYLAAPGSDNIFMSAPEFQVLDNAGHPNGEDPLTSAGANYGLDPAPQDAARPAGEWNEARIVVRGDSVEHWLNGAKVVEYVLGSPAWQARVDASKFSQWPEYGQARTGHIGLQDHGDPVWYRNIKIREIGE